MRASQNRCLLRLVGLALILGLACPSGVAGQQSEPVVLKPPKRFAISPLATGADNVTKPGTIKTRGYKAASDTKMIGASGIVVDQLQAVTANSVGILTSKNGGLGRKMWHGIPIGMAESMLIKLPSRNGSATLLDLLRRTLLSAAEPPEGESDGERLAVLRIRRLANMADYSAALNLLSLMPRHGRGEGLLRAEAEIRLLSGDESAACQMIENEIRRNQANFWQKALVFCQVLSKEWEKAELGLTLLREVGVDDPVFFGLAEAIFEGKLYEVLALDNMSPLILAMLSKTKFGIQPAIISEMAPNALRVVAHNEELSVGLRVLAVEKMALLNLYSDTVIINLYKKTTANLPHIDAKVDEAQRGTLEQRAIKRAQFYVAANRSGIPSVKAEAASQALKLAATDGIMMGSSRLFRAELAQVPVSTEMLWFAGDAFRAAIANGEEERGRAWIALLRRAAAVSDQKSGKLKSIIPLAWILNDGDKGPYGTILSTSKDSTRMVLLHALLAGLGHSTPVKQWITWLNPATEIIAKPLPHAPVWFALRALNLIDIDSAVPKGIDQVSLSLVGAKASSSKSLNVSVGQLKAAPAKLDSGALGKAAAIMLIIQAMGGHEPHAQNPILLSEVIGSLYALGLESEGRNLALEVALGAGL